MLQVSGLRIHAAANGVAYPVLARHDSFGHNDDALGSAGGQDDDAVIIGKHIVTHTQRDATYLNRTARAIRQPAR